jgi:hypothetical protein
MALWLFASNFYVFLASRIIGGLTEGNVQMSIAMISDITTEKDRSKSLVVVFDLGLGWHCVCRWVYSRTTPWCLFCFH